MQLNSIRTAPGWPRVALAVCAVGWGSNQFTALLPLYRVSLALPSVTIQATFACYVLGLLPGFLLGGPASDRFGRRAVLLPATVLSVLSALLLIVGQFGAGWLIAGRLLGGLAGGGAFSAGAAWLRELSEPGAGARRAAVAMTLGFGLGPLVAGVVAQWAPQPATSAYLPHLALAAAAIVVLRRAPETTTGRDAAGSARSPWPPHLLRVVLPTAPWVFGSAAVGVAYLPGVVASRVAGYPVLFSAVSTLLCALAGVLVQPLARRLAGGGPAGLLSTGLGTVACGLVLAAAAAAALSPPLALLGSAALGAGYGCCLVYGLAEVARMSPAAELGRRTSVYQACSYLGYVVSYPLAALESIAQPPVLLLGMAALALLGLAAALALSRRSAAGSTAAVDLIR